MRDIPNRGHFDFPGSWIGRQHGFEEQIKRSREIITESRQIMACVDVMLNQRMREFDAPEEPGDEC